jgi:GMP synthase (glutamine-hydrolysing)
LSAKPFLILQTGHASPEVRRRCGDFDAMFLRMAGLDSARAVCVDVEAGERPNKPQAYVGALVTGSDAYVTDRLPWSEAAAGWLRDALDAELPVLGVCYGHQLLAHALGGTVANNPAGEELGTLEIVLSKLAAAEPLLAGLPTRFDVNLAHEQTVVELPKGATVLATSAGDPHQILRYAPRVWSTQFHPEFDGATMTAIVERERERNNPAARGARTVDAPHGRAFLQRFVASVVA